MEFFLSAIPTVISTGLIAALTVVVKMLKTVLSKLEANNDATRYILKEKILSMCRKYQALGYIPPEEAEVLKELAREYHRLGGNSYISEQVKKTLALPMTKPQTEASCF